MKRYSPKTNISPENQWLEDEMFLLKWSLVFVRDIRSFFGGRGSETPHVFSVGEAFNGFELVFPRKIGQESWAFPIQTTGRKTTPKAKKKLHAYGEINFCWRNRCSNVVVLAATTSGR